MEADISTLHKPDILILQRQPILLYLTMCAATVILSGFLESFLREVAEENGWRDL
jgi:hypothetical protein